MLIFTDLDGTLLEHGSYTYHPAAPALDVLGQRGIPLVLASSKTAAEIAPLHAELGLGDTPAIVENGAGVFAPGQDLTDGTEYARIRAALSALPSEMRVRFRGFGDMSVQDVVAATNLPADGAALAKARLYSEPGQFTGTAEDEAAFLHALAAQGVQGRRGGRFLTLSMGRTKADAMTELVRRYGHPTTIALGDAPNDTEMLMTADYGVIIRNDHGPDLPQLPGEDTGRITRTDLEGPAGWNAAVLHLLSQLSNDQGA